MVSARLRLALLGRGSPPGIDLQLSVSRLA